MTQILSQSFVLFCEYHKHPWSVCSILLKVVPFHDYLKTFAKYIVPSSLSTLLMQPSKLHIVLLCTCKCCKLCVLLGYLVEGKLFSCICQVTLWWFGHGTHLNFEFVKQLIFSLLYICTPVISVHAAGLQLEEV